MVWTEKGFYGLILSGVLFLSVFTGCGGGGGGGSTDNPPAGDTTYNINGSVQKGPFIKGTTITIQELDKNLSPTGKTYSTETTDDFGKFSLQSNLSSPNVEITASGYYFDEVTGVLSTAPLTLRAVADLSNDANVNVNILTTLEKNRLISLVQGGKSFTDAKTQAEGEILNIFSIKDNLSFFEEMDISQQGDKNAILLSVSAILDNVAVTRGGATNTIVAELSQLIATIGSDIATDGVLDNATYKTAIVDSGIALNTAQVTQNLQQRYSALGLSITVPSFENYIDSDGDGLLNKDDFVLSFNWVSNGELSTSYISNAVTIVLPSGTATATLTDIWEGGGSSASTYGICSAVATNATLVVNGIDSGNKSVNVSNGDTIAIKLTSSATYNCYAYNGVTIAGDTGGFGVQTKTMPLSQIGTYSGGYTGLALSADGTKAYLTGSKKLQILDVSNASSPTLLGDDDAQVTTPSGGSSSGKDITLSGSRVNIALDATALQFLDISNPGSPTVQSTFNAYGIDNCGGYMSAVAASPDGGKVYSTDSCSHFFILDLTNPANPAMLKNYSFNMADQIVVSKNGQKAFAAAGNVLNILDISNSNTPTLLSQSATIGAIGISGLALSPDETKVYTSGCNGHFNVIDVTNASSPVVLSTLGYATSCSSGDGGDGIAVSGDGKRAYFGSGMMFMVFDVSNPNQPYLIGSLNLAGNAHGVALSPDEAKAYIASDAGLQIIKLQ